MPVFDISNVCFPRRLVVGGGGRRGGRKHGTNHLLFTFHTLWEMGGRGWQILTTKVAIIAVAAAP